jgi:2-isopropylmalate synthase
VSGARIPECDVVARAAGQQDPPSRIVRAAEPEQVKRDEGGRPTYTPVRASTRELRPDRRRSKAVPMPYRKYRPYETVDLPDRTWPDVVLEHAPVWCSTDLRDGNQALANPMDTARKRRFFGLLLELGFKEVEVGFPAASKVDFDFVRALIDEDLIPTDVTIAVVTQARPELIQRTFEAIDGARRAIVHLYNSTSVVQRRVVFGLGREGITDLAVGATAMCRRLAAARATETVFEYSPESFHHTELDFALEICEAVAAEWGPTSEEQMIINLPTTVEHFPPNVYADRIEWFGRRFSERDSIVLSVHPHNDRGTAVATAELGLMAGAERVEGTLFGNGERTGNVDLVTLALNLLTQGVDPGLDLSHVDEARRIVEECNEMPVHPRHPWVGDLVYTAFSGSHQDAIRKGMHAHAKAEAGTPWEVPYLPIDPPDIGRTYEAIIRVNSQSGKGGVAYLLASRYALELPRGLQIDFAQRVQAVVDAEGGELNAEEIHELFLASYLDVRDPYELTAYSHTASEAGDRLTAQILVGERTVEITGKGNGPIDALVDALGEQFSIGLRVLDYHEHATGAGADASAAAYVEAEVDGEPVWGVGIRTSIVAASLDAVVNAVNRSRLANAEREAVLGAFEPRRDASG